MKELFVKILEIEDVQGVALVSSSGEVIFQGHRSLVPTETVKSEIWPRVFEAMQGMREADLIFEKARLYIRKTDLGYLIIVMGLFAPAAMVRMNCDVLLALLKQKGRSKGLRNFFRKKG